jgi:hypothetical protein
LERTGHIVGVANHVDDTLKKFPALDALSIKVFAQSELLLALHPDNPNYMLKTSIGSLYSDSWESSPAINLIMVSSDIAALKTIHSDLK